MMKRFIAILALWPATVVAEEALIAVATNFQPVLRQLQAEFESTSTHRIRLSGGSTGVLFAQITNGAPYDAFLAADQSRPLQLEQEGFGVAGSRFTYAEGRLAFWARKPEFVLGSFKASLENPALRVLAIANPRLAPYGLAAEAAIRAEILPGQLTARLVFGENAGQTFTLAATGNADAGVVAMSSVLQKPDWLQGAYVEVPATHHPPIRQDAILLREGNENPAAREFLAYLRSDAVRATIAANGYQ